MKAFVFEKGNVRLKEMPDPVAGDGEVVVSLQTAGLNRRDLAIPNRLGADQAAIILGSDGAGVIESVGKDVSTVKKGDERSEEHTSELQSRGQLVCRLLLEKKKKNNNLARI